MSVYIHKGMSEDKVEAAKEINDILNQIEQLYLQAADIATRVELPFSYDGPAGYGDGGYFDTADGWTASSQSC